jgi:hypothetical protein
MVMSTSRWLVPLTAAGWLLGVMLSAPHAQGQAAPATPAHAGVSFATSDNCLACHNGLTAPSGEDVSIGIAWRASMMANSSRDPYWQASVRREILDHPSAQAEIEDECSICHMPMARTSAAAAGRPGAIFRWLPVGRDGSEGHRLAADGVSCALCHQIGPERLGTRESFVGRFVIAPGPSRMLGPFEIDRGRTALMRSATGVEPAEATHLRQSELCATCHTLITRALAPAGSHGGSLPEQVPYLEWRHSAFREERSCQSCHMPAVANMPISSVLGEPRETLAKHTFLGGNFFMLRMLNRYRAELGVEAPAQELDAAAHATIRQLQDDTAEVAVTRAARVARTLEVDVAVRNLTGHKLPTGYPSRRAWLHVTVHDAAGRTVFESGAVNERGMITGNDNDADPLGFEPHYEEIRQPDEVQIYESMMADMAARITTGLLQAVAFTKDNRLLPRAFDKATAEPDIAVRGGAAQDDDFAGEGDRVRYRIDVAAVSGPFNVTVVLRYQPISFRWAENLRRYDAPEPRRFVSWFDAMAASSSVELARAGTVVP